MADKQYQPDQNTSNTTQHGEAMDIHQNIGAQRRASGGPDTDFDMELDLESGMMSDEEEMDTTATARGAISGAIHNPANSGPLGSGSVNIGPGTSGGTRSMDTSGNADIMGQTSAGAGDWSRAGGASAGAMSPQGRTDFSQDARSNPQDSEFDRETGMTDEEMQERDNDRRHGVGNRATYMSEDPK